MNEKFLEVLKYLFLSLLQGITEVLPVSSSGHLQIASEVLKIKDNTVTLSVFLHLASLLAVVVYLRKDLIELIKGFFGFLFKDKIKFKNQFMLAIYLVVTTLILVLFTVLMKLFGFDSSPLWLVGLCLIINSALLFVFGKFTGTKKLDELSLKDAVVVGLFQCAGSFAGISRSGSCLCGCNVSKIEKQASAKYAFLLFVPTMVGATVLELGNFKDLFINIPNSLFTIEIYGEGVFHYFNSLFLYGTNKLFRLVINEEVVAASCDYIGLEENIEEE